MNILFLGYGKMGQALGNAWLENKLITKLVAVDPMVKADGLNTFNDQADIPDQTFDLIVLAVKPNLAQSVLNKIRPVFLNNACVISIMAGVSTSSLIESLENKQVPVIRVMPNTPVLAQAGCCILYTGSELKAKLKANIHKLFASVGYAQWIDNEEDLHAVTALSGSGPAYIHLFTEALAEAGTKLGLNKNVAIALAKQTAYGSALLQNQAHTDLVKLRENVTSPNGTTHAAIETFEKDRCLRTIVNQSLEAAFKRSIELSKV